MIENHRTKSSSTATEEADEEADDSQEHPKIIPVDAQKNTPDAWNIMDQQDEDSQEFICTLQLMRDKIWKTCVNQTVQQDIHHFFSRDKAP